MNGQTCQMSFLCGQTERYNQSRNVCGMCMECSDTDHAGVATDQTGVATDHTGVATDHTGVTTDHTGVATDHTGMATDHTGVATDQALRFL